MSSICVARVAAVMSLLVQPMFAQVTLRVSVDSGGTQGNSSSYYPVISADNRYVAFGSDATNLAGLDTNGFFDIFVRDRVTSTTERISIATGGAEGNDRAFYYPDISGDGRYVVFCSFATNMVNGDTNGYGDIFVRDRLNGTTTRVSLAAAGAEANDHCFSPAISEDGRYIAFTSDATNFVSGDLNGQRDIFVRDQQTGTTELVSVDSNGSPANGRSGQLALSADGRFVAFDSQADNLVAGDFNATVDVFLRDRLNGTTDLLSVNSIGVQGNDGSVIPAISADGRFIAFHSLATNLDASPDTNDTVDVFVRDRLLGVTERVSISTTGGEGNNGSLWAAISQNGQLVAFESDASNLIPGDTNFVRDIFVRDRQAGATQRVSLTSAGNEANSDSFSPTLSADGAYVLFSSGANNLVPADTNAFGDVFIREPLAVGFEYKCEPGQAGVIACPCVNPPNGSIRGCNNSTGTGGATLAATGSARLSMDSLVFTTVGQRQTALSILMQGNGLLAGGVIYGQGVRCVGGSIVRRLFEASAVGGSITVPDFGTGDPSVSARSAVKGDVIQPGQSRWYLVYYRDPNVLGGCPATSNFNSTQTGQVTWSP